MIRLVLWAPRESKEQAKTFVYGLVLSHDFDLFVTGYCGNGYTVLQSIVGDLGLQAGLRPDFGVSMTARFPAMQDLARPSRTFISAV